MLRDKLLADLRDNNVDLLYMCEDTSADLVIRKNLETTNGFATYFLISLKMNKIEVCKNNALFKVMRHISKAVTAEYVDVTENYQVITC